MKDLRIAMQVSEEFAPKILQMLRDFEQQNPAEIHMAIFISDPQATVDDAVALMKGLHPAFKHLTVLRGEG